MYTVTKTFKFCYAHRLYKDKGKCASLHGHTARAELTVASKTLNQYGMVCDFRQIDTQIGAWIYQNLDHSVILDRKDPLYKKLTKLGEKCFALKGPPTAENLAHCLFEVARQKGFAVVSASVWESEDSKATYYRTTLPKC